MYWNQFTLSIKRPQVEYLSEVLTGLGCISITYASSLDDVIYEPPVGQTPLWDNVTMNILFPSKISQEKIKTTIFEIFNLRLMDPLIINNKAWEDECKKDFHSMKFGENLWVCPSWEEETGIPHNAIQINMDPGLAFGTGAHQTTSLCLEYLDANPPNNLNVIDFGCGTGILSIAAAKLGATSVIAIDNDPQAVLSSKENVTKNNCENIISTIHSIDRQDSNQCDLLIANILANPIVELEPLFSDLVYSNGLLLLSGILKEQVDRVVNCYSVNFSNIEVVNKDEWFRISAKRK